MLPNFSATYMKIGKATNSRREDFNSNFEDVFLCLEKIKLKPKVHPAVLLYQLAKDGRTSLFNGTQEFKIELEFLLALNQICQFNSTIQEPGLPEFCANETSFYSNDFIDKN